MPEPKPALPAGSVPADSSATLPEKADAVPIPEPNPRSTPEEKQPPEESANPLEESPPAPDNKTPPETAPIPEPDPRTTTEDPEKAAPKDAEPAEPPPPPDPRSAIRPDPSGELPAEEIACRQRLSELGVKFDNRPAETDPAGCSMPYPVRMTSLGSGVALQPEAVMNCATAEASARFVKDVVAPAAQDIFGETLTSITHASAYVCRPRNGTQKLSEHAFGNALDIASFSLSGDITVAVEPAPPEKNAAFLGKVRSAACGPFKTVLGPGVPDHSEHLHLDLAPRRHGGTVCE